MKKSILLALSAGMILGLAACGNAESTNSEVQSETPSSQVNPETPSSQVASGESAEPVAKKTITLNPSNVSNPTGFELYKVVPNTKYTSEFTMKANHSYIKTLGVKKISKVVIDVFGTFDNLKVYAGTDANGALINHAGAGESTYKDGKQYVYTPASPVDCVFIDNAEESGTHAVQLFNLEVTYSEGTPSAGVIKTDAGSTGGDTNPEDSAKHVTLDPSTVADPTGFEISGVAQNAQYANEITFDRGATYAKTLGISKITKVVIDVFGTYDNFTVYAGTDNTGAKIEHAPAVNSSNKSGKVYTYTPSAPVDNVYILNTSDNHTISIYSLKVYYEEGTPSKGVVLAKTDAGSTGGETGTTGGTTAPSGSLEGTAYTIDYSQNLNPELTDGNKTITFTSDKAKVVLKSTTPYGEKAALFNNGYAMRVYKGSSFEVSATDVTIDKMKSDYVTAFEAACPSATKVEERVYQVASSDGAAISVTAASNQIRIDKIAVYVA